MFGIYFGSVLQYEVILKLCAIKFKNVKVNIGGDHASSKVPLSKLKHMSSFQFFKVVIIVFLFLLVVKFWFVAEVEDLFEEIFEIFF